DLIVFTEKDLLDAYLEDRKKPWWESEIPREYRTPPPSPPPSLGSRRTFYDAKFSVDPSEPLLGEEDDKYSRGFNVSYSFPPDLTRPHIYKTVVLRGSTWTQGKYNLQTREFPWRTGKITLTAYDIYNVEPASRYYTFTMTRNVDDQERARIIFNILPDEAVPLSTNLVNIISDKIAYVYLGWMYSVTLDGGKTWHLWDAERNLPGWDCCNPGLIQEINLSDQGSGVMTLRPDPNKPESQVSLHTDDFGQHWKK